MNPRVTTFGLRIGLLVSVIVLFSQLAIAGIERTAKRWYMLDIYGGTSMAHGQYDGISKASFLDESGNILALDADVVYDDAAHFGFDYGALTKQSLVSVGFRYTDVQYHDPILIPGYQPYRPFGSTNPKLSQLDLVIAMHQYLTNITAQPAAPYVGLGGQVGVTRLSASGYESENTLALALSLDFGADIKLTSGASGRSFVTLSSVNSYQIVGTSDRPKYLNIGVGLKYFFRP